ncbi:MAG: response regulator [Planctomycetales bacterium]|nr:response regulator [Planctomycetales bacterium]
MSSKKVLLVDDDPNVLKGYERRLRKLFEIETALCSEEALTAVNFLGPFAVIVSDMNMPRQNGIELLKRFLRESPESVRIMLTGNADQQTATDAINEGRVFRFLNKPCDTERLAVAIADGLEYHRLIVAERELLEQTVHGSISMLTEILSVTNPSAFGRATRIRRIVKELIKFAKLEQPWECEMAAMLSEVGCVTVPAEVLEKAQRGDPLSGHEVVLLSGRYHLAHDLIRQIPRLENVAEIVAWQDDSKSSEVNLDEIPLAAHLLKIAREYDVRMQNDVGPSIALDQIAHQSGSYHPTAINALRQLVDKQPEYEAREAVLAQLEVGWVFSEDVKTTEGILLVKAGQEITSSLLLRLQSNAHSMSIVEPQNVLVPIEEFAKEELVAAF